MRLKSIFTITNIKALQLFQLMRQAVLILVGIVLAKLALSTNEIGAYELVFYIGSSLSFFWITGLLQACLAHYPGLADADKPAFLWSLYVLFLLLASFVAAILFFGEPFIFSFLEQVVPVFYKYYILYLLLAAPCFLLAYIYLLLSRPKTLLAWGIFSSGCFLLAVVLPLVFGAGLLVSFQCLLLLAAIRHLWLLLVLVNNGKFHFRPDLLQPFLPVALPLMAYAFIGAFGFIFDKWLISWYYGDEGMFAIFSYGARELPLATALSAAFSNAMIPVLSQNMPDGLKALKLKSRKLQFLIFPVGILLMLSSNSWFPLVFNPDFTESAIIFNIYLLIIISRLLFPQTIMIALKETGTMLKISFLEILINIILSLVFVQYWGLAGVAMATFLAYFAEKVLLALYLWYQHKISIIQYTDLKLYLAFSILLVFAFYFST